MDFKLSKYIAVTGVLNPESENKERIMFSTRTGISMLVSENFYDQLQSQEFSQMGDQKLAQLMDYEIIVPRSTDEFKEIIAINRLGIKDTKGISMTIQPTANCQLGCFYCGQSHRKKTMSEDIQTKVIDRIKYLMAEKDNGADGINITWYGGEPLLGYSVILNLSSQLQEIAKTANVPYSSSMITNGLSLKLEVFKELYMNHKVTNFQITLDTIKEHHNKRRITKGGVETFDIIFNNILDIVNWEHYSLHNKKPIFIRMNIDQTNYEEVNNFIDFLYEKGLSDKVNIGFSPINNWGEKTAADDNGIPIINFAELEIEWLIYAYQKGFGVDYVLPTRSFATCMVVDESSEVYDADGNITPCYEFPYTPGYEGDKYVIGNLMFPQETYNKNTEVRGWLDDLEDLKIPKCAKCNLFPVCNGECPKKWYRGEGECPTMKVNIEDKLVLQYLIDKSSLITVN
jgi:uncharacterized protein